VRAAVVEGQGRLGIKEVKDPVLLNNSVLIEVRACAICGSDLRIVYGIDRRARFPMIIGHEMAGIVKQVGEKVDSFSKGDKVTVAPGVSCGKCSMCKRGVKNLCENMIPIGYSHPGGFAQYMVPPSLALTEGFVNKIPHNLSLDKASMAELLACCINGQEILQVTSDDTVAVIGAGPAGCMHVELCYTKGCKKIILIQRSQPRLDIAKERFHAHVYVDSSREDATEIVLEETGGFGVDVVIVAAPSGEAQKQAFEMVSKRGRVSFFGGLPHERSEVKIDTNLIHYKECFVVGASSSTGEQNREALSILSQGKIKAEEFITDVFALDRIEEAFQIAKAKRGLRVLVKPWRKEDG